MSALTKIFIVLGLVFSLVVSVLLVAYLARIEPYKNEVQSAYMAREAAEAALAKSQNETAAARQAQATGMADLQKTNSAQTLEINRLTADLATAKSALSAADARNASQGVSIQGLMAANDALTKQLQVKDAENSRLAPENVRLVQQNAELVRTNNELSTQATFNGQAIRKLQEQLQIATENAGKGGAAVPADEANKVASLTVQTPALINGKISDVRAAAGRTLIQVPLGTRDGVRKDTRFTIYRDSTYVADAVVVGNPEPDQCVAAVDSGSMKPGATVKTGDMVMSGNAK